jgi:hypothetical protein
VRRHPYLTILPLVTLACLAVSWFLFRPLLGDYPFGPPPPPPLVQRLSPAAAKLFATSVPALDFDRLPVRDAIDRLGDPAGLRVFVNWRALGAAGVPRDSPVSLHAPSARLDDVVRDLVGQLQSQHPGVRLDFTEDQGSLVLSTYDDLARNMTVRVYDVRDLVDPGPQHLGFLSNYVPRFAPLPNHKPWFVDDLLQPRRGPAAAAMLRRDLDQTVAPSTWNSSVGLVARSRSVNGQLIVTQTDENQADVAYFLNRRRWHALLAIVAARTLTLLVPTLTLTTLAIFLIRRQTRRHRTAAGYCPVCDYDCRATPTRCPECGHSLVTPAIT